MSNIRRTHTPDFKAKIALDLIKGIEPINAICSKHSIHPTQAGQWKKQLLENISNVFSGKPNSEMSEKNELIEELYRQIGQQKVELDWLKKNLNYTNQEKLKLIDPLNKNITIRRQCDLLGINRSTHYYHPSPMSQDTLERMNLIDAIYTEYPYYGSPKITAELRRRGILINHKAVERLMNKMEICAIFPRKNTSKSNTNDLHYPYLLNGLNIRYPNQVWGTDITYVRAHGLWFYLVAIMDWYSRYVIAWKLSSNLTSVFCQENLREV